VTFKSQLTTDLAVFYNYDEHAETVSYTAVGGSATDITAIVERTGPNQEPYVRGEIDTGVIIQVKRSEVSNPQHGDTYVFDSATWEHDVEGVIYKDAQEYHIALRRVD